MTIVADDDTFARMLDRYGLAVRTDLEGNPIDPFTGLAGTADPLDHLAELLDDPDELLNRRCETTNGVRLSPRHLLQAVLAGHIRRVVVDSKNHVVDFGRKHRLFKGPARDAALLLLRTCEHPGCELRAEWCDVPAAGVRRRPRRDRAAHRPRTITPSRPHRMTADRLGVTIGVFPRAWGRLRPIAHRSIARPEGIDLRANRRNL